MISTAGLSPLVALTLINRERPVFEKGIREDPTSNREIAAFQERIGSIETVDDFLKDYQSFSFVMKAFGLENQIYAKAMIKKILTSDPEDKKSLVNRLTNKDFKGLNAAMEFGPDGSANSKLKDPDWIKDMVEQYVGRRLITTQADVNPAVGVALNFQKNAPNHDSWYKLLADKDSAKFMRVALGLPDALGQADIDAQKRMFEKRMNIEDLQDPEKIAKLVRQYAAIQGANEAAASQTSILTLFSSATSSGTWSPITLNPDSIKSFRGAAYR